MGKTAKVTATFHLSLFGTDASPGDEFFLTEGPGGRIILTPVKKLVDTKGPSHAQPHR